MARSRLGTIERAATPAALALAALLLAGCSASPDPPPLRSHSPGIAMESDFGFGLAEDFSIDSNGDGTWRQALVGTGPGPYDIVVKRVHGGPERFARLRQMTERLRRRIGETRPPHCQPNPNRPPGDPVWTIRWAKENSFGSIRFRYSCRQDEEQRATFGMVADLQDEVRAWAEPMPIAERHPVLGR